MFKNLTLIGLVCGVSAAPTFNLQAETATWTGSNSSAAWMNPSSWDFPYPEAPSEFDELIFGNGADAIWTSDLGNFRRQADMYLQGDAKVTLTGRFQNAYSTSSTVYIQDTAELTVVGAGNQLVFIAGQSGATGTVEQSGGTANFNNTRAFVLSGASDTTGLYHLTGGTLNVQYNQANNDQFWSSQSWRGIIAGRHSDDDLLHIDGGIANFYVDPDMSSGGQVTRQLKIGGSATVQVDSGELNLDGLHSFRVGSEAYDAGDEANFILTGGTVNYTGGTFDDNGENFVVGYNDGNGLLQITGGTLNISSDDADNTYGLVVGNAAQGRVIQTAGDVDLNGLDLVLGLIGTNIRDTELSNAGSYYQMDGGTLLAGEIVLDEDAASDVAFIFNDGLITLDGDQTALLGESWFNAAAGTQALYSVGDNTTTFSVVPEPTTAAMLVLLGVATLRRRR